MSSGGFGGEKWGGDSFGGFDQEGNDFTETLPEVISIFEALSIFFPLRVLGAEAVSPFQVKIFFSAPLDPLFAPNFAPASYTIVGLTVVSVFLGVPSNTILLDTTEQGPVAYTVVVNTAQSLPGDPIDPLHDSANFAGFSVAPTFFATAQSRTKVQLTFSTAMLQNAAYTDPASYILTDISGNTIPIISLTPVGPTPNRRLDLQPGIDLVPGGYYVVTIVSINVRTLIANYQITPNTSLFQWNETPRPVPTIPIVLKISDFTGEVTVGLLGQPLGQVFFSPSLEAAAPNSSIQVDSISVCTKAFDTYTPPSPPDPAPLYTFSTLGPSGTLGGNVLFAPFDRLTGAKLNLSLKPSDVYTFGREGPAVATLAQPFDPAFISLLNNSFWTLFNGSGTPFITANNLAPIPPGPTQVIPLEGP